MTWGFAADKKELLKIWLGVFPSFLCLFRAAPVTYGSSQARGPIGAVAADLHHGSWQRRIINPLSEARDWTYVLVDASQICFAEPWQELWESSHLNSSSLLFCYHIDSYKIPVDRMGIVSPFVIKEFETQNSGLLIQRKIRVAGIWTEIFGDCLHSLEAVVIFTRKKNRATVVLRP